MEVCLYFHIPITFRLVSVTEAEVERDDKCNIKKNL